MVLVLMRGDHELNETKLTDATGALEARPAHPEEIREALGASAGSLGSVGVSQATHRKVTQVIADEALRGRRNMTTGANKDEHHLRGVSIERDITVDNGRASGRSRREKVVLTATARLMSSKL